MAHSIRRTVSQRWPSAAPVVPPAVFPKSLNPHSSRKLRKVEGPGSDITARKLRSSDIYEDSGFDFDILATAGHNIG